MNIQNNTLNVAFLATGFSQGNKEATKITLMSMAQELLAHGAKVSVITEGKEGFALNEVENNIEIYRANAGKLLSYPLALRNSIIKSKATRTKVKYDIIHGFSAAPLFVVRSLLSKLFSPRAKIVHTLKSESKSKWGRKFYWLLNFTSKVTVPTQVMANKLAAQGVKKRKIIVMRSTLSLKKFYPLNESEKLVAREELRNKLNINTGKMIFYYGGTWANKGFGDLLEAFSLIEDQNVFLVIAPRYELETEHLNTIKRLQLTERIKILEEINVPKILNSVDVCALPYRTIRGTEGNPSCLLEAIACKTPVVTTDLPELKEIFSGLVMVPPKNPKQLSFAIIKALKNVQAEEETNIVAHTEQDENNKIQAQEQTSYIQKQEHAGHIQSREQTNQLAAGSNNLVEIKQFDKKVVSAQLFEIYKTLLQKRPRLQKQYK